jgi:sodium-dependent dicarboxylate transporter 2/3/5
VAVSGRAISLLAGPLLALAVGLALPTTYIDGAGDPVALPAGARAVAAMTLWMALWWITEPVPVYATALLPLALFPLLGIASGAATAAAYGDPLVFLFFGGFILALALERWGLHERLALAVLRVVSPRPDRIVGAFMAVAAFSSLWVSNTATTLMLLPVAQSVLASVAPVEGREGAAGRSGFAAALVLGIAYASSIGGMGTVIGTAPNVFVASFLRNQLQVDIGFLDWMLVALPLVLVLLPAAWWVLVRGVCRVDTVPLPAAGATVARLARGLGPMGPAARRTAAVFACAAMAWIARPWLDGLVLFGAEPFRGLTDTTVAVAAAVALFIIPAGGSGRGALMDWETAAKLPWGLLILFGGGLSLAAALQSSGFGAYLAAVGAGLGDWPGWLVVLAVTAGVVFLSEVASNAATAATAVPILAAVAGGAGLAPVPLVLAACFAASCGFMLPVATPPNAIAYGTGLVPGRLMTRAGIWLNLLGILFISALTWGIIIPLGIFR